MRSRLALRASVALVAIAAPLAGLEATARLTTHALGACHPVCITQYDSMLGWTNRPGSTGRHRNDALGFDVTYRIDASGLRVGPIATREAAVERIVVLGDSNGFGWGVPEGLGFPARLARALGEVDVFNLSVTGYGTDQEYLRLRKEGQALAPSLVILQVTPNDFEDIQRSFVAMRPKPYFNVAPDGALRLSNVPVMVEPRDEYRLIGAPLPLGFRAALLQHSYAYNWLGEWIGATADTGDLRQRFNGSSVALFRRLVHEIERTTSALGAELLILHASSEIRRRAAVAFPPESTILDLSDRLTAESGALFGDDLHWNELGHRIVAEETAEWVGAHGRRLSNDRGN